MTTATGTAISADDLLQDLRKLRNDYKLRRDDCNRAKLVTYANEWDQRAMAITAAMEIVREMANR